MDRFLTELGALAWPIATIVIALIFRLDVTRAIGRMCQFKFRGIEVTFREDLRLAEQLARSIPGPAPKDAVVLEVESGEPKLLGGQLISQAGATATPAIEKREEIAEIAVRSPREAVEEAWSVVNRALSRVAPTVGDRGAAGKPDPDAVVQLLLSRGRLAEAEARLVGLLRNLRDRARLDKTPPSTEEARRFVDLALKVAREIERRG